MTAALIDHLWQSTLFCGVVWAITRSLRANSAAIRHKMWLLASIKFLVPFSALYLLGAAAGLPTPVDAPPLFSGGAFAAATPVLSPALALRDVPVSAGGGLATLAVLGWLLGAAAVAAGWWRAWRKAESISRAARPAPGAWPDVRVTDVEVEPSVARVIHPVVLLPAALLRGLAPKQLESVLAHERRHIARRDNLTANVHALVQTLFWFHPAVWWIGRQLLEERERACDEAVIEEGHDRVDYAQAILAVCRHCRAQARGATPMSALSGDLTRRIRSILGTQPIDPPGFFKTFGLSLLAVGMTTVPMAAGAFGDAARRHDLLTAHSHVLGAAQISVTPARFAHERQRLRVAGNSVFIDGSSLRELVALAYGVETWNVAGGGPWLDAPLYDVRVVAGTPVDESDELDPHALRGAVTKLLASEFDLEIHVNRRCQSPCGRQARVSNPPR
jgi:beta-lactamase regulating signal transducer with metallopeptidase domain